MARELNGQELSLYRMVWQRTLASQMADATGTTVSVRLGTKAATGADAEFAAAGTTITFPGYRQVYVESVDEGDETEQEGLLPKLAEGDRVPVSAFTPNGHATTPPARYTEASLVKKLEDLGIGRPSTWASIIQTILDRGYVWKKGQALVPTWTAFAVVNLLEKHFDELVDYAFTARMEDDLDAIARNEKGKEAWLREFYFGDDVLPGLKQLVEGNLDEIDAAEINTFPLGADADGQEVVVKPGRYGPYVKRGEDTASVPEDLAPDELTLELALQLLAAPKGDVPIGLHDGLPVYAKNGRYGPYVQWGDADAPPPGEAKPKMASLFQTMTLERITLDDAVQLLSLPRVVGVDPADGQEVTAQNGRYGPYVSKGKESRSLANEEQIFTVTLDSALALLAQPRQFRGRGPAKPPLREFGVDPVSERPVVAKEGRFGVYVTDGDDQCLARQGRPGRGDDVRSGPSSCWPSAASRWATAAGRAGRPGPARRRRRRPRRRRPSARRRSPGRARPRPRSRRRGRSAAGARLPGEVGFDGRDHGRVVGRHRRVEAGHHVTFGRHEELLEVPADVAGVARRRRATAVSSSYSGWRPSPFTSTFSIRGNVTP